jgi:hypothetical protein
MSEEKRILSLSAPLVLHSLTTVIGGVVMFAFLFSKLSNYASVDFWSRTNWWTLGATIGGFLGLYVSYYLYLSKRP